ncbi:MAG: hypothetical protein AAF226_11650 [Verrucomicrobiota bacterium]
MDTDFTLLLGIALIISAAVSFGFAKLFKPKQVSSLVGISLLLFIPVFFVVAIITLFVGCTVVL